MKSRGSTPKQLLTMDALSAEEESGIPSVAVNCVAIRSNNSGEDGLLDNN